MLSKFSYRAFSCRRCEDFSALSGNPIRAQFPLPVFVNELDRRPGSALQLTSLCVHECTIHGSDPAAKFERLLV
jgi:hypothetical protein